MYNWGYKMAETQNTGQFAKTIVTDVGKDMIAKSQNGQTLTFSRVALGDGLVGEEEDVTKFTAVKNERLSLPIAKYSNLGNGQFQIQFRLTNSQVESGFWHREIGIMAKIDNGQEQLYAYTTAGNKASFIYDKTTPVEERIVNVNFVIGNAQNLEVIINSSVIYATIEDLEEALDAHDAGTDAHEPAFDAHNAADDAHKDFTGATAKAAGKRGMVPAPAAGDQDKFLTGGKTYVPVASQTEAEGMTDDKKPMTALKVKQLIDKLLGASNGIAGLDAAAKLISDLYDFATTTEAQGGTNTTKPINAAGVAAAISALAGGAVIVDELLAQNGYVKFSNGLILQWGLWSQNNTYANVLFSMAYPRQCLNVTASDYNDTSNDTEGIGEALLLSDITINGFRVSKQNVSIKTIWISLGK